jgi:HEAT repeat protein
MASAAVQCDTLDACIVRLRAIAHARKGDRFSGMGKEEDALSERIRALPGAVDAVIPLLADADIGVAEIAAYVLRDAESIAPRYLPQIKAGLDRDLGWLAPALGRMDDDDAAREAVARLLVSDSAPHNQEAYAVELAGARAIPFIIEAARCDGGCKSRQDHYYLGYTLKEMGAEGAGAVPGLLDIAADPRVSDAIATGALLMIADLNEHARPWQGQIAALASNKPRLAPMLDTVLVEIRSDRAGEIMAARLRRGPNRIMIRDTAALGAYGAAAAPALAELLASPDWEIRALSARALGFIGEVSAAPALIQAMQDPRDVNLNWAAAVSLGRLRAAGAANALQRIADGHWHPAVRSAATQALAEVRAGGPAQAASAEPFEFFDTLDDPSWTCDAPRAGIANEAASQKLYAHRHKRQIAKLQYTTIVVSYGPPKDTPANASGVIEMTAENMIKHETATLQTPDMALRVDGGWLVGSDRGEWGGELAFVADGGDARIVLEHNIEDIFKLGENIVAVSGLAHLSQNDGMLYTLTRGSDGAWRATPWRALPGAPQRSWLTPDGRLLVNTYAGGAVLIDAQGEMSMAPCAK